MTARFVLTVEAEDGASTVVYADQRDIVRFERDERIAYSKALDEMPNALFWCLAYNALQRTGVLDTKVTRDKWEAGVLAVQVAAEAADPTQTAAPTSSLSSSPSRLASRSRKSATGPVRTS